MTFAQNSDQPGSSVEILPSEVSFNPGQENDRDSLVINDFASILDEEDNQNKSCLVVPKFKLDITKSMESERFSDISASAERDKEIYNSLQSASARSLKSDIRSSADSQLQPQYSLDLYQQLKHLVNICILQSNF